MAYISVLLIFNSFLSNSFKKYGFKSIIPVIIRVNDKSVNSTGSDILSESKLKRL